MKFPPRIFLLGFMGSGKSHLGRLLAKRLNYAFSDLDDLIEQDAGMTISGIFERYGESHFRGLEKEALHRTADLEGHVIACGGGTPCFFDNMSWIRDHGLSVFLDVPPQLIVQRLLPEQSKRPLLRGLNPNELEVFIRERLEQRLPFYHKAALRIADTEPDRVEETIRHWITQSASFVGVDYGSKLAGTTAIAYFEPESGMLKFVRSPKGDDADLFLQNWLKTHPVKTVCIDAPLSLPRVYRTPGQYGDYFYREADRSVKAMSPMFLGGLTARAMQLQSRLTEAGIACQEVYPGGLARIFGLNTHGYKDKRSRPADLREHLQEVLPHPVRWDLVSDWHAFDALLAYASGWRFIQGNHVTAGTPEEGVIII